MYNRYEFICLKCGFQKSMLFDKSVNLEHKSVMRRIKVQVKCSNCGSYEYTLEKKKPQKKPIPQCAIEDCVKRRRK